MNDTAKAPDARPALERVVVGMDFSAPSVSAVGWTREHLAPQAACVLVHALDVPQPPRFLRGVSTSRDEVIRSAREGATARMERLRNAHGWGAVTCDVRDGRPEDVLAAAAADGHADIIVVGEHTHPRSAWSTLGSTAEALVRSAAVPVLLARNAPDRPPSRILIGVDESAHGSAALAWGHLFASRFEAAVTVFHVFRAVYLGAARAVSGMEASLGLEQEQLDQAREWIEGEAVAAGFTRDRAQVRIESGDPASALVAAQRGGAFDLVIIGSRGSGGVGRMLLGSVANSVLRGASCPVLVVGAS